jgi:hypothetical protein
MRSGQAGTPLWVACYSNDVITYVASLGVLREGGDERSDAMRYNRLADPSAP